MTEERRSLINTYLPILVAVLLSVGGAYVAMSVQLAHIEQQLTELHRQTQVQQQVILDNTKALHRLNGLAECED